METSEFLCLLHTLPDLQCAWPLRSQGAGPRCDHLLRTLPPSPRSTPAGTTRLSGTRCSTSSGFPTARGKKPRLLGDSHPCLRDREAWGCTMPFAPRRRRAGRPERTALAASLVVDRATQALDVAGIGGPAPPLSEILDDLRNVDAPAVSLLPLRAPRMAGPKANPIFVAIPAGCAAAVPFSLGDLSFTADDSKRRGCTRPIRGGARCLRPTPLTHTGITGTSTYVLAIMPQSPTLTKYSPFRVATYATTAGNLMITVLAAVLFRTGDVALTSRPPASATMVLITQKEFSFDVNVTNWVVVSSDPGQCESHRLFAHPTGPATVALISVILFRLGMVGPTANDVLLTLVQHTKVVVVTAEKEAGHIADAGGTGAKYKFAHAPGRPAPRRYPGGGCAPGGPTRTTGQLRAGATTTEAKRDRGGVGARLHG